MEYADLSAAAPAAAAVLVCLIRAVLSYLVVCKAGRRKYVRIRPWEIVLSEKPVVEPQHGVEANMAAARTPAPDTPRLPCTPRPRTAAEVGRTTPDRSG